MSSAGDKPKLKTLDRDVRKPFTPPKGVTEQLAAPVPVEVVDECTGKYEGDELKVHRAARPTEKRFEHLEANHDRLREKVDVVHSKVSRMEGKLDTALAFILDGGKTQRTKITTNGKIIIAIAVAALSTIGIVVKAMLS